MRNGDEAGNPLMGIVWPSRKAIGLSQFMLFMELFARYVHLLVKHRINVCVGEIHK